MPELTEDEVLCPWCGERTHTDMMVPDPTNTEEICTSCFEDIHIETCEWCHGDDNADSMVETDAGWLCNDCHGESFECDDCGDTHHTDSARYVGGWRSESTVCEDCYEGSYFYCEGCDESMSLDDYGSDGYCQECDDDGGECDCGECGYGDGSHEGIRRWGDRPDLKFHDTPFIGPRTSDLTWEASAQRSYDMTPKPNTYYLGMEIELSHTRGGIVGDFVTEHHDMMWATTDATVDDGFEIVTMPITYDAWMTQFPWEAWKKDIHNVVPNQEDYQDNGIHIHISRSAFANSKGRVLASHLYKFMQFIRVNEDAVMTLAGRGTHSYCKWDQTRDARDSMNDAKASTSMRNYERYRPINTQNRQTIELRFFDGRSDPTFMKRALQFITSVTEFTRHGNASSDRTWETYVLYVKHMSDMYPDLDEYFTTNGRRLLMGALTSEHRYKDAVMPRLKADKLARLEEARRDRQRELERAAERERMLANMNDPCACDICTRTETPPTREVGDLVRTYMDGNFRVHVYQTEIGQRHQYAHVVTEHMNGEYYMGRGFTGDVEQAVWNRDENLYENVTLQREAR